MQDMVIIGNGPAGLSAALYLLRAGFSVTIIGKDNGALSKAEKIENYFGLPVPQDGNTLVENGKKQAAELGAVLLEEEVVGISWNGSYQIATTGQTLESRSLLLATGSPRKRPAIPGLKELEGKGVSYCAVCDAFFYRGKDVAVLGNGEYALHEAQELLPLAGRVTLLTNGTEPLVPLPEGLKVDMRPIERLAGEPTLQEIRPASLWRWAAPRAATWLRNWDFCWIMTGLWWISTCRPICPAASPPGTVSAEFSRYR